MPRYDQTGPEGRGPKTGWGNGKCAGNEVQDYPAGYAGRGGRMMSRFGRRGGRGFFRGGGNSMRGRGRGFGYADYGPADAGFVPADVPEVNQTETLKREASFLKTQLEKITQRLSELENKE